MTIPDDLPECVRRLVKPRLALRTERQDPSDVFAGVWGGTGVVPLPDSMNRPWDDDEDEPPSHLVSVTCGWLERNGYGIRGWMSVYRATAWGYIVVTDFGRDSVRAESGGLLLFGREEWCLPEEEVLDAYLTTEEKAALAYTLEHGYAALGADYTRFARAACPIYRSDVAAVLGGWHICWPEGPPRLPLLRAINDQCDAAGGPGCLPPAETYPMDPYRLVLWTLRDAEPWVEVLVGPAGDLHALSHVT